MRSPCCERGASIPSAAHVSEGKQAREEGIRLNASSDPVPIRERQFRLTYQVESFAAREATRWIVVRFVAGLLKFDDCAGNPDELRLQGLAIQAGGELSRHAVIRELLGDLSHYGMTERPSQTTAESSPVAAANHALRCFINQQMKDGVVGRRNCPVQTCLQRPPRFLDGELSGLPQQVSMQAHDP